MLTLTETRPSLSSIVNRTFHIVTHVDFGTAFAIEVECEQYLVTAKHILTDGTKSLQKGEMFDLFTDNGTRIRPTVARIMVQKGEPSEGGIDVGVLRVRQPLSLDDNYPELGRREELFLTQTVAMTTTEHWRTLQGKLGVVTRTGSIAKFIDASSRNSCTGDFLLAMEAYPGFSGSPVVYWDEAGSVRIAGVASRWSWGQVSHRTSPLNGAFVHTGFTGCFHIDHVMELINQPRTAS